MKRGTPDHPKTLELARLLHIPKYAAVGILECLWHFTAQYAPAGDIGRYSDERIMSAIGWRSKSTSARSLTTSARSLIEVLVRCGWVERHTAHRLIIHDWADHADQAVRRKLARQGLVITSHRLDTSSQELVMASHELAMTSLPEPEPLEECITVNTRKGKSSGDDGEPAQVRVTDGPKKKHEPNMRQLLADDSSGWNAFREAANECGLQGSEHDWAEARGAWPRDPEFRLLAIRGLHDRAENAPDSFELKALPQNYLRKRMWERRIERGKLRQQKALAMLDQIAEGQDG